MGVFFCHIMITENDFGDVCLLPITNEYVFFFLLFFETKVSCSPGWLRTYCVAEDDLECRILQLPPPGIIGLCHHTQF